MRFDPDTISKNIKRNEEMKNIFFVLIYIILTPVVLFSIFLTMIELGKNTNVPDFLNYEFYTVVSESMMPKLKKDDIIIVQKDVAPEKIKEGNIITFEDKYGEIITHRVSKVNHYGEMSSFVTKGDNNEMEDEEVVTVDNMIGRVVYTLPSYLLIFKNRVFFSVVVSILIIIIMINVKLSKKKVARRNDRERYESKLTWDE